MKIKKFKSQNNKRKKLGTQQILAFLTNTAIQTNIHYTREPREFPQIPAPPPLPDSLRSSNPHQRTMLQEMTKLVLKKANLKHSFKPYRIVLDRKWNSHK